MNTAKRNSNIELLRIICIFLIILRHYSNMTYWPEFTCNNICFNTVFLQIITIFGEPAVSIFLLISGYYMIDKDVNYRRLLHLTFEMIFYSFVTAIVFFAFKLTPFSLKELIKAMFPFWFGYNWYVCCYIVLCCFVPFINHLVNSLSREEFRNLVIVSIFIESIARTLMAVTYLGNHHSADFFITVFLLGGYIKKYGISPNHQWKIHLFISLFVMTLSVICMEALGYFLQNDWLVQNSTYFSLGTSPISIYVSLAAFMYTIEKPVYSNNIINSLAKSVVGIFFIHHNTYIEHFVLNEISPNINYFDSKYLWLHAFIKSILFFLCCLAIDQFRINTIDKLYYRFIDSKWNSFLSKSKKMYISIYTFFRNLI